MPLRVVPEGQMGVATADGISNLDEMHREERTLMNTAQHSVRQDNPRESQPLGELALIVAAAVVAGGHSRDTGRSLFATHSGGRSPCGVEAGAPAAGEVSSAHTASRPRTVQSGRSSACQQAGVYRLGVAGQGRHLSSACACGSGLIRGRAIGG